MQVLLDHGADPRKGYWDTDSRENDWLEDWAEEFPDDVYAPSVALVAARQVAIDRKAAEFAGSAEALGAALRAWAVAPEVRRFFAFFPRAFLFVCVVSLTFAWLWE